MAGNTQFACGGARLNSIRTTPVFAKVPEKFTRPLADPSRLWVIALEAVVTVAAPDRVAI